MCDQRQGFSNYFEIESPEALQSANRCFKNCFDRIRSQGFYNLSTGFPLDTLIAVRPAFTVMNQLEGLEQYDALLATPIAEHYYKK